jgi:hypothetical protein
MLDDETAQDVTTSSVRATGNLYPIKDHPIGNEMALGDLRIKGEPRLEELKTRIIKRLNRLDPPYDIDKDAFRDIDQDTLVGDVVAIVTTADPI